jgi:hypothetical protein
VLPRERQAAGCRRRPLRATQPEPFQPEECNPDGPGTTGAQQPNEEQPRPSTRTAHRRGTARAPRHRHRDRRPRSRRHRGRSRRRNASLCRCCTFASGATRDLAFSLNRTVAALPRL